MTLATAPTQRAALRLALSLRHPLRTGPDHVMPALWQVADWDAAEAIAIDTVQRLEYGHGYCASLLRTPTNA